MFIILQFPFTDARPFIPTVTHRLPYPVWEATPQEDKDFVRSFGEVKRRVRGGSREWASEGFYCRAKNALHFDDSFSKLQTIVGTPTPFRKHCAFRRFLADGCAVARMETGIKFRSGGKALRYTGDQTLSLIRSLLSQRVTVSLNEDQQPQELFSAQHNISKLYLKSSTSRLNSQEPPQNWWFSPGTPLLVLEYIHGVDVKELPKYVRPVQAEILTDSRINLSYTRVRFGDKEVGTWLLGITPPETDIVTLRNLRLNLLRFHAETESIRQILRLIASEKLTVTRGTTASDKLQKHLHKSIQLLSREYREGLPQSKILDIAQQQFDEIISAGQRDSLLEQISSIRRNYFLSVKTFTQPKEVAHIEPVYDITKPGAVFIIGSLTMQQTQNIHGNVTGNVNQVAAKTIQDSFNTIAGSSSSPELKEQLDALGKAVTEMVKGLPEPKQKQIAKDYKNLTEEVTSEEPRREWYELSAKGLMEAAKAVGEIATPVIAAVKAILLLLA
jgi:hypothetical protein